MGGSRAEGATVTKYKCPHCGWLYNPSDYVDGFALVPDHIDPNYTGDKLRSCDGALQHPRNAESDKRPLWRDGGVK